jgi:hypothetical protein
MKRQAKPEQEAGVRLIRELLATTGTTLDQIDAWLGRLQHGHSITSADLRRMRAAIARWRRGYQDLAKTFAQRMNQKER